MQKKLLFRKLCNRILLRMAAAILLVISVTGYAQSSTKSKLYSFRWENSSVSAIFKQVEDAAKVHFSYNPKDLDLQEKITTQVVNKSLPEVIDAIASKIKLKYKIDGETVMLQADKQSSAAAPSFKLYGKVFDSSHNPLAGATVTNNTTSISVATNSSGDFTIEAHNGDIITFSIIGFEPLTIIGNDKTQSVNISLKQSTTELKTVVVTALGIKREEKSLGYAYSEVDGSELKKAREINVINSLEGKVAGLVITSTAGGNHLL